MKTLNVIKVVGLVLFVIQLCGIDFANSMSVNTEILKNVTQVEDHSKNLLEDSKETVLFSFKNDVESIQPSDISKDNDTELEETFHRASINFKTNIFTSEDIESPTIKHMEDHHLVLVIGVLLLIACIGIYGVLITWRYYIEKRYGMMEQLVTEDDYYSNNDVRHF